MASVASIEPLKFKGVPGSPYTRKMLAYLRYRHIPYELLIGAQDTALGLPEPKVSLLPTFYLPDEHGEIQPAVDSTPLIRRFEQEFSERAAIPSDPVLKFLNYLIEDYADEWLTKAMFHYRWHYAPDIDLAGTILPHWSNIQASAVDLNEFKHFVANRQISRLHVVGSNPTTAPVIEASYERVLKILDQLIESQLFIFGARPSSADFGIYAQLTQLVKFDPTPTAVCLAIAPRVSAWTDLLDDLSGHPADPEAWLSCDEAGTALRDLLTEIGRTYAPALLANAEAIGAGQSEMQTTIDEQPWTQPVFPYQAKCLQWINEEYQQLDSNSQLSVDAILAGTGCDQLIIQPRNTGDAE